MPLDPDFIDDCLYLPEGLLIDEILSVDAESSTVRVRMPTHADLPITRAQRVVQGIHPRHVSGGLMVHMTGVAAFAHFYYVLGLRHRDRWTGYGVRIHEARYLRLAHVDAPLVLECQATRTRRRGHRILVQYQFRFFQEERPVYEGKQAAMWLQVKEGEDLTVAMAGVES